MQIKGRRDPGQQKRASSDQPPNSCRGVAFTLLVQAAEGTLKIRRSAPVFYRNKKSSSHSTDQSCTTSSTMSRPLLHLFALSLLAGAALSEEFNLTCTVNYYGNTYDRVYMNITSNKIAFCFGGYFSTDTGGDCIMGPLPEKTSVDFNTATSSSDWESAVQAALPSVTNSLGCNSYFIVSYNVDLYFYLFQAGSQTVLGLTSNITSPLTFDALVNGATVQSLTASPSKAFADISSSCSYSGALYGYNYGKIIPEACIAVSCNATGSLDVSSTCGPEESCLGNNICGFDAVCTVTGPTVIDFHGQVNSVKDRCAYSLVSVTNLTVLATFQERRRKDVSFVDSVTLKLGGLEFHLGQGGRVLLNGSVLTLNSSAQLVHGVELSKDQTGVTAKVSLSDITTSVFFDGSTAQIDVEVPAKTPLQGLCRNSSSSLSELRLSDYSSTSCETQYNDTADSSINCTRATERCELLKEAPFSACNGDVDPEPYITACTDTLCTYPAVDGLNCQFLEAYARVCSLYSNTSLEGWRSKAGCSPEAFCQDRTCSDHEFCGEKLVSGGTGCLCRAIFASPYRGTDSLGDPTVCRENSASLTLVGCLLEEKDVDYSVLHLNDQNCRGQMDQLTHMVTFSFNSSNCGTVVTANNSQVTYKNTIRVANTSDVITRHDQFYIDFSCVQTQPDIKFVSFKIKDSSVVQHISSGPWNYTLTMKTYTDSGFTQAVDSNTEVMLNQKVWVELETDGLDKDVVAVVTDSCWATDQPSSNDSQRYDLIIGGCANPADRTVWLVRNGVGTSNYFSFNMFQFSGSSTDVYLHCKLKLCVKDQNSCTPTCGARRRRSSRSTYEAEAFISMGWTG
ncbi:alpha-tectorin-like [Parambassis ranga]|uniref:Alpha-tectorin-like n=1 Tax=Parambassis ranga TaxID=210632 RepID=A0A6P7HYW3_9TELE|nr:alpha-tectorin-like [Parambassis ranga]